MNISNALFEFTQQIVNDAPPDSPLSDVLIHPYIYVPFKPGKTIRIDDVRQATPVLAPDRTIRDDNAIVDIQFAAMPKTQELTDMLAARETGDLMAKQWLLKSFDNSHLETLEGVHRVCAVGVATKFMDWIKPGTVTMPVCVLRLVINPRS